MTTWYGSGCARQDGERRWLEELGNRRGDPIPAATIEDLWRLYALAHRRPRLLFGGAVAWRTRRSARPRSTRGSSMASRPSAPSARPRRAIAYSSYLGRLRGGRDRRSAAMQPGTYYTAAVPCSRLMNALFIGSTDFLRRIAPPILRNRGFTPRLHPLLLGPAAPMPPAMRERLLNQFRDDIEKTASLIGRDLSRWLTTAA